MPKYVVYEVWTKSCVITAKNDSAAYDKGSPKPRKDELSLCNWHIQKVPDTKQ